MKLKELLEDSSIKGIDEDTKQLIKVIQRTCPRNFMALVDGTAPQLFRATEQKAEARAAGMLYFVSEPRTAPRESQTLNNLLINFTSSSPLWKNVPRRNYSSSTATTIEVARGFAGTPHLIIPADNVKSFAYTDEDFNTMMLGDDNELIGLNLGGVFSNILSIIKMMPAQKEIPAPEEFMRKIPGYIDEISDAIRSAADVSKIERMSKTIDEICEYVNKLKPNAYEHPLFRVLRVKCEGFEDDFGGESIIDWLNEHVTPEKMGVKVANSYTDISKDDLTSESEVWFEGSYLAIRRENQQQSLMKVIEFLKQLKGEI